MQSRRANGDFVEETVRPTYEDAFMLEYRHLHAAVVDGAPVKTTPADGEPAALHAKLTHSEGGPGPVPDGDGRTQVGHSMQMVVQMNNVITTPLLSAD